MNINIKLILSIFCVFAGISLLEIKGQNSTVFSDKFLSYDTSILGTQDEYVYYEGVKEEKKIDMKIYFKHNLSLKDKKEVTFPMQKLNFEKSVLSANNIFLFYRIKGQKELNVRTIGLETFDPFELDDVKLSRIMLPNKIGESDELLIFLSKDGVKVIVSFYSQKENQVDFYVYDNQFNLLGKKLNVACRTEKLSVVINDVEIDYICK